MLARWMGWHEKPLHMCVWSSRHVLGQTHVRTCIDAVVDAVLCRVPAQHVGLRLAFSGCARPCVSRARACDVPI